MAQKFAEKREILDPMLSLQNAIEDAQVKLKQGYGKKETILGLKSEALSIIRGMETGGEGRNAILSVKAALLSAVRDMESQGETGKIGSEFSSSGMQKFNSMAQRLAGQIMAQDPQQDQSHVLSFISESLKAYYNASSENLISKSKFMAVDVDTNTFYVFDMSSLELEGSTYAALGSGGINVGSGSHGTPPGLSKRGGTNPGNRGGFTMPGLESFNGPEAFKNSNEERAILIHNRNGPKGNLGGAQRTTWGCVGISEEMLNHISSGDYLDAGLYVYSSLQLSWESGYIHDGFLSGRQFSSK